MQMCRIAFNNQGFKKIITKNVEIRTGQHLKIKFCKNEKYSCVIHLVFDFSDRV